MKFEEFADKVDVYDVGVGLSVDIHTWELDGDRLIGELKEINEFKGGSFENSCKRYLLKTDHGLVSTILGSSVDKQIKPEETIGKILCITYRGKIQLADGKSCNRFTVIDVTEAFNAIQKEENIKKAARTINFPDEMVSSNIGIEGSEDAEKVDSPLGKTKVNSREK